MLIDDFYMVTHHTKIKSFRLTSLWYACKYDVFGMNCFQFPFRKAYDVQKWFYYNNLRSYGGKVTPSTIWTKLAFWRNSFLIDRNLLHIRIIIWMNMMHLSSRVAIIDFWGCTEYSWVLLTTPLYTMADGIVEGIISWTTLVQVNNFPFRF